jgi:hypothetical protein
MSTPGFGVVVEPIWRPFDGVSHARTTSLQHASWVKIGVRVELPRRLLSHELIWPWTRR